MKKLPTFATLVTAALTGITAESAWSYETIPNRNPAAAEQIPAYRTAPAPGWYPPPPLPNAGRYAQPWQQQPYRPTTPRGYGQMQPPYPRQGQYQTAPATSAAINPLSAELKHTQEQLTAKSAELGKVQATLEQLRVILQHRLEAEIALNEKVATITSEQQALQARVTELTAELNDTTASLEQNRQQISTGQEQTLELTKERDQLRDDLASRDRQLATLQDELQARAQTLKQVESETTLSSQKLIDATAQAKELENKQTLLQSQLENQKTALRDAERALADVIAERDNMQADVAARSEELTQLQTALTAAESKSEQSLADVVAERDRLKADLAARSEELTQAQTALTAAETKSEQSLADVVAERDRLKADLATRSEKLTQAQTALTAAESKSEQSLADVLAEHDKLKADLATRSEELTQAQADLTTTQSELAALRQAKVAAAAVVVAPTSTPEPGEEIEVATAEIAALQTTQLDTDGDGVPDSTDLCGDTQQKVAVDGTGCADGVAINLEGVNFRYDSHELTSDAQRILDRIADILTQQPDLRLEVAGHTDSQGDPAYNQWLSLKRAEAVRDYIVAQGVNPNHIGAGGYGGQRPIADNSTKEGLRMNRRVELRRLQ